MTVGLNTNGYYNQGYAIDNTYVSNNNQNVNFTSNKNDTQLAEELAKKKKKIEKDDGSIGFFKALGNFGKGVAKFFTGMVTDEKGNFSLFQTLKTAAIAVGVGAVTVLTAGTAVPAMIAAAGIGVSALGMGKAAIDIATADTDAEAEAAWQSLGSNTTAGALALVGAKAVAKSSAGANAAEFDGATGYLKAGKQVFKDSGKAIADSATGFKNAYTNAGSGFEAKFNAVKTEAGAQKTAFVGKVKGNFENTVYGTKEKVADDAKAVDEELKETQSKKTEIKDKNSTEYKKAEAKEAELTAKRDAMNEVNNTNSWEDGRAAIDKMKADLESQRKGLSEQQIKVKENAIKSAERVLERRTNEAQFIRNRIEAKQEQIAKLQKAETPDTAKIAELRAEITELQAKQEFKIPGKDDAGAVTQEQIKASNETVKTKQTENETAQNKYNELNAESSINDRAYAQLEKIERKAAEARKNYEEALNNNKYMQEKFNVQEGNGFTHPAMEIGQKAYASPSAKWLTVGVAGRQFGNNNPYSDFYSMLNSQEKAYFKGLSEEEKAALLTQYNQFA